MPTHSTCSMLRLLLFSLIAAFAIPSRAIAWEPWPEHGALRSATITWSAPPEVRDAVRAAFAEWGRVSGISGVETASAPLLIIAFGDVGIANTTAVVGCGADGDGYLRGCTMTIDAGIWARATDAERLTVILHEVGHAIGLGHGQECSVMSYVCHTEALSGDDGAGVRWITERIGLTYRQSVAALAFD